MQNRLTLLSRNLLRTLSLKIILVILSTLTIFIILLTRFSIFSEQTAVVAITQIVEHQSLDDERKGIFDTLKNQGYIKGKNLKVIYENAQGSVTTAAQIAIKFASLRPNVVVAISTPSAQSLVKLIQQQKIPLVFSAVTDPVAAKLIPEIDHPGDWVTGVSDFVPAKPQLELMTQIIPSLKTIGIIYNPGESNSLDSVKDLEQAAKDLGLTLVLATASKTSEVPGAVYSLIGKVQAIFIPPDNTAISAIKSIVKICIDHQLPVFTGDVGSVQNGAIATAGYDRYALGTKAGEMVVRILKGEKPSNIPISKGHPLQVTLNPKSAKKMGIVFSESLLKTAKIVKDLP